MNMTPAERAKAYYHIKKMDPVWAKRHRERNALYRAKKGGKEEQVRTALEEARDIDTKEIRGSSPIKQVAHMLWVYRRWMEKHGVVPPFEPLD